MTGTSRRCCAGGTLACLWAHLPVPGSRVMGVVRADANGKDRLGQTWVHGPGLLVVFSEHVGDGLSA